MRKIIAVLVVLFVWGIVWSQSPIDLCADQHGFPYSRCPAPTENCFNNYTNQYKLWYPNLVYAILMLDCINVHAPEAGWAQHYYYLCPGGGGGYHMTTQPQAQ